MQRVLRSLALAVLVTAIGGSAAWALSPDDAIYLTQQGVDDDVIIAKICADGEAWDLSADDIVYLRDHYVDEDVIEALIDPAGAADRFGYALGDGDRYDDSHPRTAYVYSLGYYYGPIARYYFCDPFFYSYLYCDRFSFGFSYWPTYYASYCYPYYYGYYAYPYFYFPRTSYYYGYNYCGAYYDRFRTRYRDGYVAGGNVRWRDWNTSGRLAGGTERPRDSWRISDPQRGGWRNRDSGPVARGRLNNGERTRDRMQTRDPVAYDNRGRGRVDGNRIDGNRTWTPRGRNDVARGEDRGRGDFRRGNGVGRGEPERDWQPRIIRGRGAEEGEGRRAWDQGEFQRGNPVRGGNAPERMGRRYESLPDRGRAEGRGWGRRAEDGPRFRQEAPRAPERSRPEEGRGNGGRWDGGGHADNGRGSSQGDHGEGRRR